MNTNFYCVYQHIFPNGKQYIGIAYCPETRWQNGNGYKDNPTMYLDIVKYGWANIEHNILFTGLTKREALEKERDMIVKYETLDSKKGYNRTGTSGMSKSDYDAFCKNYALVTKELNDLVQALQIKIKRKDEKIKLLEHESYWKQKEIEELQEELKEERLSHYETLRL